MCGKRGLRQRAYSDTAVLRYATPDLRNEGAAHAASVYRPMSNCFSCRDVMRFELGGLLYAPKKRQPFS